MGSSEPALLLQEPLQWGSEDLELPLGLVELPLALVELPRVLPFFRLMFLDGALFTEDGVPSRW